MVKLQNTSAAVMAQRIEPQDSLDNFPTPPWATRALITHVLSRDVISLRQSSCLEPAAGAGHMVKPLREYFAEVIATDIYDYGVGYFVEDFLAYTRPTNDIDWVITNPPFRLAQEFVLEALRVARRGVAIFARSQFLEGKRRYQNMFLPKPPDIFAQFVERVPLVKGRLDYKAVSATSYAWFVWKFGPGHHNHKQTRLVWIPPCRKDLERKEDYF